MCLWQLCGHGCLYACIDQSNGMHILNYNCSDFCIFDLFMYSIDIIGPIVVQTSSALFCRSPPFLVNIEQHNAYQKMLENKAPAP